jgi:ribosomal protein S18 acetylase RimI-like enzyme
MIVGCGGWSARTPQYAAHLAAGMQMSSTRDATVRSVYVHPQMARSGIARRVMAAVEADIVAACYPRASLTATLGGIPLYRKLGYRLGEPVVLSLDAGRVFVGLAMSKPLAGGSANADIVPLARAS